jgi:hypothetical protein
VDVLLAELEEVDGAVRALYGELAADPDLAGDYEPRLKDLHARRLDLAQRVGLASLARRRAAAIAEAGPAAAVVLAPATAASTPPVPAPEDPPSTPASDDQVAEWKSAVRSTGLGHRLNGAPSDGTTWPLVLHELMGALGLPRMLDTSVDVIEETDALDAVGSPDRQAQWARLPRNAQQAWLSMLVARTRALKELPSTGDATKARVKEIIGRYPPWAKAHGPGHVNGMQIKHAPVNGSWARDAQDGWKILDDLLGEEFEPPSSVVPKKRAKRAESEKSEEVEDLDIEAGWRLLPLVRGCKAILLGGDPREPNRQRLERALQLASLEWPPIDGPRKVEAVVERIRKGTYGLVLVLTPFVFHKQSSPIIEAAKDAGVAWALVEGYGVAATKQGLERFLGGPRGVASTPMTEDRTSKPNTPSDGEG